MKTSYVDMKSAQLIQTAFSGRATSATSCWRASAIIFAMLRRLRNALMQNFHPFTSKVLRLLAVAG